MRIESEGIILNLQKHTDNSYIANVFSKNHGAIRGLIRNKKNRLLSIGNNIFFKYTRKNVYNLGNFTVDSIDNVAVEIFFNPLKLLLLHSALSLLGKSLPENETNEIIFHKMQLLQRNLENNDTENSIMNYIQFEMFFLQEMGFGLNLQSCPIHGTTEKFGYISPKIARVISEKAGHKYQNRLFKLPKLLQNQPTNPNDLLLCLQITAFFMQKHIFVNQNIPSIRLKLQQKIHDEIIKKHCTI